MVDPDSDIRDAFFEEVYHIADKDRDFVFISDDMDAFGLKKFREELPKQYINIGVAEQNMMDLAAGLATCGKKVFAFGISTFVSMRCFEQIRFSICSMNLPVSIIGIGAGFSFEFDGPSHHGTSDLAIMRLLPEMTIYNPCDATGAAISARLAYSGKKPAYIRLDKGSWSPVYRSIDTLRKGYEIIKKLTTVNIVSTGTIVHQAINLGEALTRKFFDVGIVDVFRVKPLNTKLLADLSRNSKVIITIEENSFVGGLGSIIAESQVGKNNIKILSLSALDKQLLAYGSREWLLKLNGLSYSQNFVKISQFLKKAL